MKNLILALLCVLVTPGFGQELSGTISVAHPGFDEFRFTEAFVYLFEINDYVEVLEDGTFVVELLPGRYSLKTYVPGFEPTYRTVFFPDQDRITMPVTLQLLLMEEMRFERTVPKYLERIREQITNPDNLNALNGSNILPVLPPTTEPVESGASVNKLGRFLRRIFGGGRDEE